MYFQFISFNAILTTCIIQIMRRNYAFLFVFCILHLVYDLITMAIVIWQNKATSFGSKWHPPQHTACRYLLSYSLGGRALVVKLVLGIYFGPQFRGEEEAVRSQGWYHSKERWWFPTGFPRWPWCAISNHSATICHRMSPTLKSTGVVHVRVNLGRKSKRNFWRDLGETWGCRIEKKSCWYLLPFWAQCTNVTDRQTDRQTNRERDHGTVASIAMCEIVVSTFKAATYTSELVGN